MAFREMRHVGRGATIRITVDDQPVEAYPGETIAGALLAAGRTFWRRTRHGEPRGLYCGIGLCFDCTLTVDGVPNIRGCMTPVRAGMIITTGSAKEPTP